MKHVTVIVETGHNVAITFRQTRMLMDVVSALVEHETKPLEVVNPGIGVTSVIVRPVLDSFNEKVDRHCLYSFTLGL